MSVSVECKAGENENIYIIDNFSITGFDENGKIDEGKTTNYHIGDRMFFLDWYDEMIGDNLYTKIKCRDETGREFSAIESFFVTEDVWQGLHDYFKEYFRNP
jgi:hypothetical protein